jgi:hypothetical protein
VKLESARELKRELVPVADETSIHLQDVAAQRVVHVDPVHRTVAFGVAPAGRSGYRLAVRVQRRTLEESKLLERVHRKAMGEVDVRYVGRIRKRTPTWFRKRQRPLQIGTSIGHFSITAGTIGCFVSRKDGATRVLSNNHVLADENRGKRGDDVLQPGRYDGGTRPRDTSGELNYYVPLRRGRANLVDCALASLDVDCDPAKLHGSKALQDPADEDEFPRSVEKLGRTTGHTFGRVTAFELDNVVVQYDIGNLRFDDQVEIEGAGSLPFSQGGDSGALIWTTDGRKAFALLFAGGDHGGRNGRGLTFANPIAGVLKAVNASLLT